MEFISLQVDGSQLLIGNLDFGRIGVGIEAGTHPEAVLGGGVGDEIENDLVAGEGRPRQFWVM